MSDAGRAGTERSGDLGPRDFHTRARLIGEPARPPACVAPRIDALLGPRGGTTLLLGVTPSYAEMNREIVALDWNPAMIAQVWPGDTPRRRAILGDWRAMPLADASIVAACGDGPPTMLRFPDGIAALASELRRVLVPGARVAMRCFVRDGARDPAGDPALLPSFHAYKLLHNLTLAARDPHGGVISHDAWAAFEARWPDRRRLAALTGWSLAAIAEIDSYCGQSSLHSYPTRAALRDHFAAGGFEGEFHPSGDYPLAGHCPILVLTAR